MVASPGLFKEVQRYSTGQPMGRPLPPGGPPGGMEDLMSAKTMPPASTDLMFAGPDLQAASRVEGSPADAMLPRPGRGSSPGKGGRPGVMPGRRA
jgi:hypothetical protein